MPIFVFKMCRHLINSCKKNRLDSWLSTISMILGRLASICGGYFYRQLFLLNICFIILKFFVLFQKVACMFFGLYAGQLENPFRANLLIVFCAMVAFELIVEFCFEIINKSSICMNDNCQSCQAA